MKPTTLRFYEQAGLLPARRSPAGYRLYGEESVERLSFIASGKHLGLPLEEIRALLQVWEDGLCTDVRERLRPMPLARIAEAERRAGDLEMFSGRLRAALAEIVGPPRSGRCDPGCGFLHSKQEPTPVPVELKARSKEPVAVSGPTAIACTLSVDDQASRIGQWRQLLAGAHAEVIEGGRRRFHVAAQLAGPLAELAAAEQRCCAFFLFTLRLGAGGLRFEVHAPAEAAALVAEVFGVAG
jgi:DNA-binding transcriptional MerR regulator